jgi:NAD(P)-dependent dehydrogenase (short-subunit alcohol dehydrogenase family)
MRLGGARVLVAGGSHRVGRAVALELAQAGADVAVSYHLSQEPAEQTVADIRVLGRRSEAFRADAASTEGMRELVRRAAAALGGLDGYVHAPSGGFVPRSPEDLDEVLWDAALDTTAKAFLFAAQQAYRELVAAGGGAIVALNDVAAVQPWPKFAAHCAAKAAQLQLVKCLARAWGREGVRVCAVSPGPVLMPDEASEASVRRAAESTALGRLGSPEDVARAVRFCFESDYLTGQSVMVDGGLALRG